jgi:hypothetical protein
VVVAFGSKLLNPGKQFAAQAPFLGPYDVRKNQSCCHHVE